MSSKIAFYLQLTAWTISLSLVLLLGFWILVLPPVTITITFLMALLGLGWVYLLWRQGLEIMATPISSSVWLLWSISLLATIFSTDPSRSWYKVWMWSACLLAYYFSLVAFRSGWKLTIFIKSMLLVLTIAILSGYIQLYMWLGQWYSVMGWPGPLPPRLLRVWGITTSPNELAILITIGLMPAAAYFIQGIKKTGNRSFLLWLGWILMALPVLLITGSRSGWIAVSLGLITLVVGFVWLTHRGVHFFSVRIMGRLVGISLLVLGIVMSLIIWRRPETLQLDFDSVGARIPFWRIAMEVWQAYPWLGSGPATYGTAYMLKVAVPFQTAYMHAHNLLFNTLAEMGIIGLFALLFLGGQVGWFLWRVRHSPNWDSHTIALLAVLVAFMGHGLFEMPETWVTLLVTVCFAGITAQLDPLPMQRGNFRQSLVGLLAIGLWVFFLVTGLIGWQANRAYTVGVTALESGDWTTAATQFEQAQLRLPYFDSGIAVAQGLNYSVLATENPDYLARAEEAFAKALMAEPGWPFNHANLAAIYWEQGKKEEAIAIMQTAVALSPEAPVLYLNLGLWYEEQGNGAAAQAVYETLYGLPRTPREIAFWGETVTRQMAVSLAIVDEQLTPYGSPGYLVLDDNPVAAADLFLEEVAALPDQTVAYLGLGVAYIQIGDDVSAAYALQKAQALDIGHATVRLYGSQQLYIKLWQAVLVDNEQDRLLRTIIERSMLEYGNYSLTLFGRVDPPYDLLPQLYCFDRTPLIAMHLNWLHTLYAARSDLSETERATFELVKQLHHSNGIQPCQTEEIR